MIEVPESSKSILDSNIIAEISSLQLDRGLLSQSVPSKEGLDYFRLDCMTRVIETSYYIGVNWLVENKLPVCIRPKLNRGACEIDYIGMLVEAMQEPENLGHLDGLLEIEFDKPAIPVTGKEDILSPFLVIQFLLILQSIVKKGLKRSYYLREENLSSKVKGKILLGRNLGQNVSRGRLTHNVCQFQEYGVDCDENRLLKKAYLFACSVLQQYTGVMEWQVLEQVVSYIRPAFQLVSDKIDVERIRSVRPNPIYAEYSQAIRLAKMILRRYAYNITSTKHMFTTPPFWIDMSKLFELYVYKKLRSQFSGKEVKYHLKARGQELDFILNPIGSYYPFIIDAKYKPRYKEHSLSIEDVRQISGYARLEKVYDELGLVDHDRNIRCLIIYSHQDCPLELPDMRVGENWLVKERGYVDIFKLGIALPELSR